MGMNENPSHFQLGNKSNVWLSINLSPILDGLSFLPLLECSECSCVSDEVAWNQINHEDLKGSNNNKKKKK